MKNKCILFTILILGFLLIMPYSVLAENITLGPGLQHSTSYELGRGDTISWEWKVTGEGYVDFWIVDEEGNKHNEIQLQDESSGSFDVPEKGSWNVVIKNNGYSTVEIEYDVSVDDGRGFPILLLILPILIIIVCILLMSLMMKKKAELPPKEDS
jgi:hypothetical protein